MGLLSYYRRYQQRQRLLHATYDNTPNFSLDQHSCWVKIVKVIDGDTVHAAVILHGHIYRWSCRLQGIDCAEMRSNNSQEKALALAAKERLQVLIGDNLVWAVFGKSDKYGRPLVDLSSKPGRPSFSTILLSENLAYSYNGKKKKSFAEWHT